MEEIEVGLGPKVQSIENLASAPWNLSISHSDYTKLLAGFEPQDMDDKWLCLADKPDAEGNTTIHAYRSWTGQEQVSFKVTAGSQTDKESKEWATIEELSWDQKNYNGAEEAKELAVILCKRLLGCEMTNTS